MLDIIFASKARIKILNFLFLASTKTYTIKELSLNLNLSLSFLRKELKILLNLEILKTAEQIEEIEIKPENKDKKEKEKVKRNKKEKKENKILYQLNDKFLLYSELKALFLKSQVFFSQEFIANLKRICEPKFLALSGIFTGNPEAQTDILIVGSIRRANFLKLLKTLEKKLGREINFTIMTAKEFHYRENIMDIFLYNILEGNTLILVDNIHKISQK